ncbi:hypothetical protein RRG08_021667 [Elysia crispata]|uniref:Uncharacterized protein n=1 Tax=Elysia crispata TaxID=231223 RepID=A0AAE0XN09_9GAST|nr:hypothetical protein RRG08_021667 [Elysia crispata]
MSYLRQPVDPRHVQDRKLEKLQQAMLNMEQQMADQASLRRKLEQIGDLDEARTQQTLERANSRNKLLQNEIDRVYGSNNPSPTPVSNKMVEEIISKRTKEFQRSQATKAATIQYLAQERQRILDARSRLKERQATLRSLPSPVGSDVSEIVMQAPGSRTPAYRSVHSSDSVIRKAVEDMPDAVDRIWNLRENLHRDYEARRKPYNGELGLDSYQPWQIPDFIMVRKLLEEFVEDFLIKHLPPDDIVFERDMKVQMLDYANKDWHRTAATLSERSAVKLVAEEMLLEVTSHMIKETANEGIHQDVMFKRIAGNVMIKEAEIQATGNTKGREPSDEAYDLITLTFSTMQRNRDKHKKGLWSHSQALKEPVTSGPEPLRREPGPDLGPVAGPSPKIKGKKSKSVVEDVPEEEEPIESDVQIITHGHLLPLDPMVTSPDSSGDDAKVKAKRLWTEIYTKQETMYWKNLRPFVFGKNLPKRCQGVTCVCPSKDHTLVAVGTTSGDVVVLNSQVEPWEVVKFDVGQSGQGPVVSLAWTLDGSRLLAVTQSGNMSVWLTKGQPPSRDQLSAMGFPSDPSKPQPFALTLVHSMRSKKGDYTVTQGTLAEQETRADQTQGAAVGGFFPSLTFLASQVSVCAGMTKGDVLKLDLTSVGDDSQEEAQDAAVILKPIVKPVHVEAEEVNLTQQGVEVELLRQHRYPVIHLGFIGNIGKMVTVDSRGFINIWKYDRDHVTDFDWFFPEKKYKLDLNKTMYSPSSSDRPQVIFSDQGRSKETTQAQLARERRAAEQALHKLKLSEPWHVSRSQNPPLQTYIYVPPGGSEGAGAMFNVVARHIKTEQLSMHVTRVYRPVKVPCSRFLTTMQTPSGEELVFVLLFPEYPPKGSHLMILVLDLPTMKLRNFRRDIPLEVKEFFDIRDKNICSAGVTQVYGPTGSNYLFLTVCGRLSCISLNSGAEVLTVDSISRPRVPRFPGLKLDDKQMTLTPSHMVATLGNLGSLYLVLYEKNSTSIKVLRLENGNTHEHSRLMCKAYERWDSFNPQPTRTRRTKGVHCPSELRINPLHSTLPDMKHKEAEMRSLLLGLPFTGDPVTLEDQEQGKIGNYRSLESNVEHEALLSDL